MRIAIVAVAMLGLAGCKETAKDRLKKCEPRFDEKWQVVSSAAAALPSPDAKPLEGPPLDPPVHATDGLDGNTDIIDADKTLRSIAFVTLGFPAALERGYGWLHGSCPAGFPCPAAGEDADKPAETIARDLEAMLARRYVVFYHVVHNKAPAPAAMGQIDLQAVLIDLSTGKPLRTMRVLALAPAGGDWDRLVDEAHDALIDTIEERTGGKIELKRRRPKAGR